MLHTGTLDHALVDYLYCIPTGFPLHMATCAPLGPLAAAALNILMNSITLLPASYLPRRFSLYSILKIHVR